MDSSADWLAGLDVPPAQYFEIPEGDAGADITVRLLREQVEHGIRSPAVRMAALHLVSAVRPFDKLGEVKAVYEGVRRNYAFRQDVWNVETIHTAEQILKQRAGDCDDINGILLPALLGTLGYETRYVVIASNPADPTQFSHIYPEVNVNGRWYAVDAAREHAKFGKHPERRFRTRIYSVFEDEQVDLQGGISGLEVRQLGVRATSGDCRGLRASNCITLQGLGQAKAKTYPMRGISRLRRPRVQPIARRLSGLGQDGTTYDPTTGLAILPVSTSDPGLLSIGTTGFAAGAFDPTQVASIETQLASVPVGYGVSSSGSSTSSTSDLQAIASLVGTAATGTSNIIRAVNAPAVATAQGQAAAQVAATQAQGAALVSESTIQALTPLFLIGIGIFVVMKMV